MGIERAPADVTDLETEDPLSQDIGLKPLSPDRLTEKPTETGVKA